MKKSLVILSVAVSLTAAAAQTDISPIGKVRVGGMAASAGTAETTTSAAPAAKSGKDIYTASCAACHATGAAGAPKLGDAAMWAPRIATGVDALVKSAISGKGAMPPKGGNMSLSDDAIKETVEYMVNESK